MLGVNVIIVREIHNTVRENVIFSSLGKTGGIDSTVGSTLTVLTFRTEDQDSNPG